VSMVDVVSTLAIIFASFFMPPAVST